MGAQPQDLSNATETLPETAHQSQRATNSGESPALNEADLFELLSNQRRRVIFDELLGRNGDIEIGTLAQEIAAIEDDVPVETVSSADRKRVYTALHQSHLPKMAEAGVIEFDSDRGTIEPTPALDDVEIYMDIVRGRDLPWSEYYLGLTALSGLLFAGAVASVGPLTAFTPGIWGVFVLVTFGSFALAHRHLAHRQKLGIEREQRSRHPRENEQ